MKADKAIARLKRNWNQLHPLDRAETVAAIKRTGTSNRQIAKQLGRSESLLRHLLRALEAPAADIKLARQGQISINELVRKADGKQFLPKKVLEQQIADGAKLICNWLHEYSLDGRSGKQTIGEARIRISEAQNAGKLPKFDPPENPPRPAIIIERARPTEPYISSIPAHDWFGKWLARWIVYVIPNLQVRDGALKRAEQLQ